MGSWLRNPHTTQERRATGKRMVLHIDGYAVHIRARRNASNLPTNYDDMIRSDMGHKTWKRHRDTQYHQRD